MKLTAVVVTALCIAMLLVSCMKQATPPPGAQTGGIEGIQWYLTEVGGSPVSPMADDKQPHILLDPEEKQATGFAGCNHFFGSYELDEASLTFGPIGATRMACPDLETGLEASGWGTAASGWGRGSRPFQSGETRAHYRAGLAMEADPLQRRPQGRAGRS